MENKKYWLFCALSQICLCLLLLFWYIGYLSYIINFLYLYLLIKILKLKMIDSIVPMLFSFLMLFGALLGKYFIKITIITLIVVGVIIYKYFNDYILKYIGGIFVYTISTYICIIIAFLIFSHYISGV